jgi:hypothetical protein
MTEAEYQKLKAKIEKEFPVRLKLAELAGLPKINVKNYKALEEFDMTIDELVLMVMDRKPENLPQAQQLLLELYK